MIVRRVKYYIKKVNKRSDEFFKHWDNQKIKRTSYWLFGVIPIYINNEIIDGAYEK